jgi:hypothetical protein
MDRAMEASNLRQLRSILELTWPLEAQNLARSVRRIDTIFQSLNSPTQDWMDRFFRAWMVLEEVNAVTSAEGESVVSSVHQELISKAVSDLRSLVDEQIDKGA